MFSDLWPTHPMGTKITPGFPVIFFTSRHGGEAEEFVALLATGKLT